MNKKQTEIVAAIKEIQSLFKTPNAPPKGSNEMYKRIEEMLGLLRELDKEMPLKKPKSNKKYREINEMLKNIFEIRWAYEAKFNFMLTDWGLLYPKRIT